MPRPSTFNYVWLALLLTATTAAAQGAETDPNAEAARLSDEAAAAYAAGDLDGALDLFEQAMRWVADPAFAYNVAFIYDELGVLFPAYRHYGRYLELYPGAPNRAEIEARLAELEATFRSDYAELRITTSPTAAELWVRTDDREVYYGVAPLTVWVPPGAFTLEARLEDHGPTARQLNGVAGVRLPLELALAPSSLEVIEPSPLWPWAYGTIGTGVALMGIGIAFWVASDGTTDDYNTRVAHIGPDNPDGPSLSELRALGEDGKDQARVGNVLFGVGASVLAGGIVLLVLALDEAGGLADTPAETSAGWRLQPSGLGFELLGRF